MQPHWGVCSDTALALHPQIHLGPLHHGLYETLVCFIALSVDSALLVSRRPPKSTSIPASYCISIDLCVCFPMCIYLCAFLFILFLSKKTTTPIILALDWFISPREKSP